MRPLQGKINFQGLPVSVENRMGNIREWHDPHTGESGMTRMERPYGYIRGTLGTDGDHVDCYVGPQFDAKEVYIIHQNKAPEFKEYDEDKVMLGFDSAEEAKAFYLRHYDDKRFFRSMTVMTIDFFKEKVMSTRANPRMLKAIQHPALLKSRVKAHSRRSKTGKVSMVKEHVTRVVKKAHKVKPIVKKVGDEYKLIAGKADVTFDLGRFKSTNIYKKFGGEELIGAAQRTADILFPNRKLTIRLQYDPTIGRDHGAYGASSSNEDVSRTVVYLTKNIESKEDAVQVIAHELTHAYQRSTGLAVWGEGRVLKKWDGKAVRGWKPDGRGPEEVHANMVEDLIANDILGRSKWNTEKYAGRSVRMFNLDGKMKKSIYGVGA